MDVAIDEPRKEIATGGIDGPRGLPASHVGERGDDSIGDEEIGFEELLVVDIEDLGPGDAQVGACSSTRDIDDMFHL